MKKDKLILELNSQLNEIFNDRSLSPQERGELGEDVVFSLSQYWVERFDDNIKERSFIFEQGPILPTTNSKEANPVTEIDILIGTPYAIFALEVKTVYGNLVINEDNTMQLFRKGKEVEYANNNYLRQNEMHCRHLYYQLHGLLPEGRPEYIIPLIVLTGKMKLTDKRSKRDKSKYPITITNNLIPVLERYNQPKEYLLDIRAINKKLAKIKVLDHNRLLNSQKFN